MKTEKESKKTSKEVISFNRRKFYFIVSVVSVLAFLLIICFFLFVSGYSKESGSGEIGSKAFFKCVSRSSKLYTFEGCRHCTNQKSILGDGLDIIEVIDCRVEWEKCSGINAFPTWVINGEKILGVQTLESLAQRTGC